MRPSWPARTLTLTTPGRDKPRDRLYFRGNEVLTLMRSARPRPGRTWLAPGALLLVFASVVSSVTAGWAQSGRLQPKSDGGLRIFTRPDGLQVVELTDNVSLTGDDIYLEGELARLFPDVDEFEVVEGDAVDGNAHDAR